MNKIEKMKRLTDDMRGVVERYVALADDCQTILNEVNEEPELKSSEFDDPICRIFQVFVCAHMVAHQAVYHQYSVDFMQFLSDNLAVYELAHRIGQAAAHAVRENPNAKIVVQTEDDTDDDDDLGVLDDQIIH